MKARHCFLTLIGETPFVNVVMENDKDTELMSIEITDSHLSNLLQDGVKIAFRPERAVRK
jgi:hypothetical protein